MEADVVIDFSNASAVDHLLDYCAKKKLPVVLCTTGLSEEQLRKVEETAEQTAVLKSANMSLGINLLLKLLQNAAKVLGPAGFDIELVERHHNQKVDAPSGTALALADSVNEALDNQYTYVFDRSQVRQKRGEKEIGISAVRGGTIVGDHEVIFAGADEVIEFKHTAYSKAVFGKGAVEAAKFLAGKKAGKYDMSDVIQLEPSGRISMKELEARYLERLSQLYPTIAKASTEIINLQAILNLPKGTEHFLTDIHGEHEAFSHVLKNGSGSVRRKIDDVFGNTMSSRDKQSLATLIYYPKEKMDRIKQEEDNMEDWYKITLYRLIEVCKRTASKYTRSKVRKALPPDFAYVIEELITEKSEITDKESYYN